ncbi:hypothetical protein [Halorarius litoreus]|uniref:hypothetical protein n=1 Tax=Halorarius litoreus TaxID=2962676 RepID=UPI0020CF765C|nr:hypothetical protein [Halorarius litoreus]
MFKRSEEGGTTDEEILNVLRRSDEDVLGTSEIAEFLEVDGAQTRNRLNDLHDEDRVGTRKIGNTRIWVLGPEEPATVVHPEIASIQRVCRELSEIGRMVAICGAGAFVVGGVLLIAYLAVAIGEVSLGIVSAGKLAEIGLGLLAAGGVVSFLGGAVMASAYGIEGLAKRRNHTIS